MIPYTTALTTVPRLVECIRAWNNLEFCRLDEFVFHQPEVDVFQSPYYSTHRFELFG
jgi:hypothetical protein